MPCTRNLEVGKLRTALAGPSHEVAGHANRCRVVIRASGNHHWRMGRSDAGLVGRHPRCQGEGSTHARVG